MSASVSGMRGGQPSTTQPIAAPWLSPKLVNRKRWPNVLKDMGFRYPAAFRGSNHPDAPLHQGCPTVISSFRLAKAVPTFRRASDPPRGPSDICGSDTQEFLSLFGASATASGVTMVFRSSAVGPLGLWIFLSAFAWASAALTVFERPMSPAVKVPAR